MIAKETLTSGCDADASPSSNIWPDSRVERRLRRRPGVEGSTELARFRGMRVLKFGGSSLATPDCIRDVGQIVRNTVNGTPAVIVVSAFQGVTNQLLDCARLAERRDPGYEQTYIRIAARHSSAIDSLLGRHEGRRIHALVDEQLGELRATLHGICLRGQCPRAALDVVASFGERLSALIVSAYLNRFRLTRFVDARQFLTTDEQFTRANVIFPKTNRVAREYFWSFWRQSRRLVPVVTGFIGSTEDGRTTTIGRNGSDYTAAIIGAALGASMIEIWTDVDGVLSADPKEVSSAFVLPQMTYDEATEMSCFGAKVLHPGTIGPAVAKSIPIVIKNTFNPTAPGTLISRKSTNGYQLAKGISSLGDLTLLTLQRRGTSGVGGTAARLFRALASHAVNVILVSQASEHAICFAVNKSEAATAVQAVDQEFRLEFQHGLTTLDQKPDQAIVAVIGQGMKGRHDVASRVFGALGGHSINISAIAQGASGRNVSCVVDASQRSRALNVIHQGFFETRKTLALVIVGVGNIGGALLRQLCERQPYLFEQGFDAKVIAVANSKNFVIKRDGINLGRWREALDASDRRMDPHMLAHEIAGLELANAALIDCTAESSIVDAYPEFIKANLHIITPNKRANVLPWRRYTALRELLATHQKHFLYETNAGAGLPIMSTLRDLIASGDVITKMEGIFSGTLSYLFNTFDDTAPFSTVVREAHRIGYTEPDPREDLTGQDVSRKLLIVARHIGLKMELDDVCVDSLIPRCLTNGPFSEQFFSTYAAHDVEMGQRLQRARERGAVLRYVGTLERGRARAEIRELPRDHAFATTKGCDNIVAFTTNRYAHTPLIVQGPGAGVDVTAMGVFSDIFKLLHLLKE
jgi:aspartokinase/homoserine dehydrogenase 1